jgi:transposase
LGMRLQVTEDLIARQTPEAQAIIRLLRAQIEELTARVAVLEARLNKTPQNSSLPPSSQHPHAKPLARKPKSKKKRSGQPGHASNRQQIPIRAMLRRGLV